MNKPITADYEESTDEILSLLVPMASSKLILPTVSVAEMVPYQPPKVRQNVTTQDTPEWYLGSLVWRGVLLPMMSYEALNGAVVASIRPESQLLILNSTGATTEMPFFCFPTQGIPRLTRVVATEISENPEIIETATYEDMPVLVVNEAAVIPDIGKLECAVASLLGYI